MRAGGRARPEGHSFPVPRCAWQDLRSSASSPEQGRPMSRSGRHHPRWSRITTSTRAPCCALQNTSACSQARPNTARSKTTNSTSSSPFLTPDLPGWPARTLSRSPARDSNSMPMRRSGGRKDRKKAARTFSPVSALPGAVFSSAPPSRPGQQKKAVEACQLPPPSSRDIRPQL